MDATYGENFLIANLRRKNKQETVKKNKGKHGGKEC
jgi:hypothetical protein